MISSEVQRTLVKSPPELWTELSDPDALARHLGELGEIRITHTEPEKLVEWEATDTSGKVLLKPSGWGTKVTLIAARELAAPEPPPEPEPSMEVEPEPEPKPEPMVAEEPEPEPHPGFFARFFRRRKEVVQPEPEQPAIIEVDEPAQRQRRISGAVVTADDPLLGEELDRRQGDLDADRREADDDRGQTPRYHPAVRVMLDGGRQAR